MSLSDEKGIVTAGHAVKTMVLNGLGFVNPPRYLVPHFFQNQPLARLIAPGSPASYLNDDTLGRALETLDDYGVTALSSLMAATAAQRLGLAPGCAYLDRTRFPVDGRSHRDAEPEESVLYSPRGDSRDQRPALHHVMLAWVGAPHAGLAVLRQPRRGQRSETQACGHSLTAPRAQ